jgi:hypothetical protein
MSACDWQQCSLVATTRAKTRYVQGTTVMSVCELHAVVMGQRAIKSRDFTVCLDKLVTR